MTLLISAARDSGRQIRNQQDEAYEQSLRADREKVFFVLIGIITQKRTAGKR
jgi:hypothetical protein